jgi:hypothetical protein
MMTTTHDAGGERYLKRNGAASMLARPPVHDKMEWSEE